MKNLSILAALVLPLLAPAAEKAVPAPPAAASARSPRLLVGASVGALVPLSPLGPSVAATLEAGVLARLGGGELGGVLGFTYDQPVASGAVTDPRMPGGAYDWSVQQRGLVLTPALLFRLTSLGFVVPYASLGPRFSFLDQSGSGTAGTATLGTTTETLARVGATGRIGAELLLGIGGITVDALFEWTPLGSVTAGADTQLLGVTAQVGYRLVF